MMRTSTNCARLSLLLAFHVLLLASPSWGQSGVEFWIGDDPGAGNGTFQPSMESATLSIPSAGLADGHYRVGMRPRNDDGAWGLPYFVLLRVQDEEALAALGGEYFWDEDPGFGQGQAISLSELNAGELELSTDGLGLGDHTLGLRIQNMSGWGITSWDTLTICTNYNILGDFEVDLDGNLVFLSNTSTHADSVLWTVSGDSTFQDSTWNPTLQLRSGEYTLQQQLWNECDTVADDTNITIRGATYVEPRRMALGATGIFTMRGAFDGLSGVELRLDTLTLETGFEFIDSNTVSFGYTFPSDLAYLGAYDLCTSFDDGSFTCLDAAVDVDTASIGLRSNIVGPRSLRPNVEVPFEIVLENTGNDPAYAVPLMILVEGPCDVYYHFSSPDADAQAVIDDPTYADVDIVHQLAESHAAKLYLESEGDSVWINNALVPYLMPGVPVSVWVDVTPTGSGGDAIRIQTQMGLPWYSSEQINDYVDGLNAAEMPWGPAHSALMLTECDMLGDCGNYLVDAASLVAPPGVGCVIGAFNIGCAIGECVNAAGGAGFGGTVEDECMKDVGLATINLLGCAAVPASAMRSSFKKLVKVMNRKSDAENLYNTVTADCETCSTKSTCGDDDGSSDLAASIDPNEKVGPLGWGDDHWLPVSNEQFYYRISCENVDSATATAAEVRMVDTLDMDVFDVRTLTFESFEFAGNLIELDNEPQRFIREVDLQPAKNAILRVSGEVDTLSGVLLVRWESLDPTTRNLTYDIDAGFLNPNVNPPEGEAHVSFSLNMWEGAAANGLVVNNVADIYFDQNEVIRTDVWSNPFDGDVPSSTVLGASLAPGDSALWMFLDNVDPSSGVRYVSIYQGMEDDMGAVSIELVGTYSGQDTLTLDLLPEQPVAFFAVAEDGVGNVEDVLTTAPFIDLQEFLYVPAGCDADFTGDGVVDSLDLLAFLTAYGSTVEGSPADLNANGWVDSQDLLLLLSLIYLSCW